ncbi:MAG: AAA family ATPase [Actinomycetota bacterium]|nr:AAA family ATPase [Actinomycetota bacterium]
MNPRFEFVDLLDIEYRDESDRFLIDGLVSTSATLIAGLQESGKTSLAIHLVHSLLSGQPFAGRQAKGGPHVVCWMGSDPDWRNDLRDSVLKEWPGRDRVLTLTEPAQDLRSTDNATLVNAWIELGTDLEERGVTVLVIDNLTGFGGSRGLNKTEEFTPLTNALTTICDRGIAVILIAHSAKGFNGTGNGGRPGGGVGIPGWRRVGLGISGDGRSKTRKVEKEGNHGKPFTMKFTELNRFSYSLDPTTEAVPDPPGSANRNDETARKRAEALLDAEAEHRANQTAAGKWLAENDPVGVLTGNAESGRTTVRNLMKLGWLGKADGGTALVAGHRLTTETQEQAA